MPVDRRDAFRLLEMEARALLTRLAQLRPYALNMPMVTAAAVSPAAQTSIEGHMIRARRTLRHMVRGYLRWLRTPESKSATPAEAQRRFTVLRLRFNDVISQFEIFKDVLAQRSEHATGVWVAGLDDLAADAIELAGGFYNAPPVVCYVDRGHGAAIRRARTRLPGGDLNPVAVIKVPRERMVGSGIASSLVHEVGHQAAALMDLVNSLRPVLRAARERAQPADQLAWQLWERWISEIVADFWSVARVGITSTLGLLAVVSLPRVFVFRVDPTDPHPTPWIRVRLSTAIGRELFPHPQWDRMAALWQALYPLDKLDGERRALFARLEASMPEVVRLIAGHRPRQLAGRSLREALSLAERQPAVLARRWQEWRRDADAMRRAPPTIVFAAVGQARADGRIAPEEESRLLTGLLTHWAVTSALGVSAACAARAGDTRRLAS